MPDTRTPPVSNENASVQDVVIAEKAPVYYPHVIPDYGPEVVYGYQDHKDPASSLPQAIQHSDTDKIVLHGRDADRPEAAYIHSPLYVQSDGAGLEHYDGTISESGAAGDGLSNKNTRRRKRIWGLRPLTFWLLVLFAVVLIGAAVAGGVSGSIIRKKKTEVPASPAVATTGATTTTKQPESATTSTPTTKPSATPLDYAADLNYSLQVYEEKSFQGRSHKIRAVGTYKSLFPIRSYTWQPGPWTDKTKVCSSTLCRGDFRTGWRGQNVTEEPGLAWTSFPDSMIVVCGGGFYAMDCPEKPDLFPYQTPEVSPAVTRTSVEVVTATPEVER